MAKTNMKKAYQKQPQPETYIVQATDIVSSEQYRYRDEQKTPVLNGITLDIKIGECWGVIGEEAFELELLLQIIANVRPYGSGRCSLVERGMMRRKSRILPHVFYISGGDTVPVNLNTLEYLMYVTSSTHVADRKRQAMILESLLDSGLHYLTLAPLKYLSTPERAAVCLLSAALSKSLLVVFSVAELTFPPQLAKGVRYIAEMIEKRGGALLIGTNDCDFAQEACTHAAFLVDGKFAKSGDMPTLLTTLDQRAYILTSNTPQELAEAINNLGQGLQAYVFDHEVHIYARRGEAITQEAMMYILLNIGYTVESLQTSKPTLANAFKEVLAGHVI